MGKLNCLVFLLLVVSLTCFGSTTGYTNGTTATGVSKVLGADSCPPGSNERCKITGNTSCSCLVYYKGSPYDMEFCCPPSDVEGQNPCDRSIFKTACDCQNLVPSLNWLVTEICKLNTQTK